MQITPIANASLLITHGDTKLLIDAPYADEHPFNLLPAETLLAIEQASPPFDGITHILFTHLHPDHFDQSRLQSCLGHQRPRGIYFPADANGDELAMLLLPSGIPFYNPSLHPGEHEAYPLADGLGLIMLATAHMGEGRYAEVPNAALLLYMQDEKLLITGDSSHEYLAALQPLGEIGTAVVNPLFCQRKEAVLQLQGLGVERLLINHIPEEKRDTNGLGRMAANQARRLPFKVEILL